MLYTIRFNRLFFLLLFSFSSFAWTPLLQAQKPQVFSSADIAQDLEKLQVLGRVLYLAAHPDDENTRLITYLANEEKYQAAYLSLTRGSGGQNLIGPEIQEKLGLIRTQELLQARRVDGGQQFFSSARDFGFSKHPDETFEAWDREQVLAEVVYIIRSFKPHVIITRFNTEPGGTHGHHTASAILAQEAFQAAADADRFPEQLDHAETWQPERLLWNTSSWFYRDREDFDTTGLIKIDVGAYNPFFGKSYTEIAAESRSMHKSQGFGAPLERGKAIEYLKPVAGSKPSCHLFEGIDVSWSAVDGGEEIERLIQEAIQGYEAARPEAIVPQLLTVYHALQEMPDNPYKKEKSEDVKTLIRACLGLYLEAVSTEGNAAPGDSLQIRFESINRSDLALNIEQIILTEVGQEVPLQEQQLVSNIKALNEIKIKIPEQMPVSQPYWLQNGVDSAMFSAANQENIGKPENDPVLEAIFEIKVLNTLLSYRLPVVYKYTAPAEGEIYQPFYIIPPVAVNVAQDKILFTNEEARELSIEVVAGKDQVSGELKLELPAGWKAEPALFSYGIQQKGASQSFRFKIFPPASAELADLKVIARYKDQAYSHGMEFISYDHIPTQVLFPEAKVRLVRMSLKKEGQRIAYLMGAGDNIPESLRLIGYQVDILEPEQLNPAILKRYDALVLGIRAFNTVEELRFRTKALEQYAREGGTVIIQYNTSHALVTKEFAPYALNLSRERVTVEEAPVRMLEPEHPVFQRPNKITQQDFEGWVQERGLYFADEWSDEWTPLLASQDPGEDPREGGLLLSRVGKGYYVYTGYSWFRQLPAGVPGAYKLFVNLLSLGNP